MNNLYLRIILIICFFIILTETNDLKINNENNSLKLDIHQLSKNVNTSVVIDEHEMTINSIINLQNKTFRFNMKFETLYTNCITIYITKNDYFKDTDLYNMNNLLGAFGQNILEEEFIIENYDKFYYVTKNSCPFKNTVNFMIKYTHLKILTQEEYNNIQNDNSALMKLLISQIRNYNDIITKYNDNILLLNNLELKQKEIQLNLTILEQKYEELIFNLTNLKHNQEILVDTLILTIEQKQYFSMKYNEVLSNLTLVENSYNELKLKYNKILKDCEYSLKSRNIIWTKLIILVMFCIILLTCFICGFNKYYK